MQKIRLFVIMAIVVLTFSACSRDTATGSDHSTSTPSPSTTELKTPEPTATAEPAQNNQESNAGQAVKSDFVLPKPGIRPVAVMIDNEGTKSLPQGGLDKAQLIYEVIVEGGETRLMPVFWETDPKLIGPVRSSRHYFLDYAMEHDAVYVHIGWSPMAKSDISKLKINNINGISRGGAIFWELTKDRKNWQDSYTSMSKIQDYIKKVKYRNNTSQDKTLVFTYQTADTELMNGQKAETITMRYSSSYTSGFVYDAASKTYKRLRKGKPQMERSSGLQLTGKNIIIQRVANRRIKGDTADRQTLDNIGKGTGWYITEGKAIKINWSKSARSAATKYTDETGKEIMLNPGQTWIQIVPASGKVTIE